MSSIKDSCGDVLGEEQDDIFVLRYAIHHKGDADAAADALRSTVAWRREKASMLASATPPHADRIEAFLGEEKGTFLSRATKDGCPMAVIRAGQIDAKALMAAVSDEELVDYFLWQKEQAFRSCDEATRATGLLVQQVTANDLSGVGIKQDKLFGKALGDSSKLAQTYYPALQGTVVLLNLPLVAKLLFAFFKPLLPAAVLAKLKVCPGNTAKGDIGECPFAKARLDLAALPSFLGGSA